MTSLFIFRRDLRLTDNTTLILADKQETSIIPIFIFDPHQLENSNKSDNCVQFMVESLKDLKKQLHAIGSNLHACYGEPWIIVGKIIKEFDIKHVYFNQDYTKYSKYRDKKIQKVCDEYEIPLTYREDCLLTGVDEIKTTTGKHYEKFTPYYDNAKTKPVREPQKHTYKNLVKKTFPKALQFKDWSSLFTENSELYMHGGRTNGTKILSKISNHSKYNINKNNPYYDTTLLSPHNKFGTVSVREVYHKVKKTIGSTCEILRQLYWRDFYYTIAYHQPEYFDLAVGKYATLEWKNNKTYLNQWKTGKTGIPIVDASMKMLTRVGWIHNRCRLIVASMLTKVYHIDWRIGEKYFQQKLIDYDVTQNIMNWYWVSGEVPFANPYFRVLNPIAQQKTHDEECSYSKKWTKNCSIEPKVDVSKMIEMSIKKYAKY